MNTVFSFKRFQLLVKSDLIINWKQYVLGSLAIFAGLFLTIMTFIPKPFRYLVDGREYVNFSWREDDWIGFLMLILVVYFAVLFMTSFSSMKDKASRTRFLLLPASGFEKFLHQFLLYVVVMGPFFYLLYWLDAQLVRQVIIWHYDLSASQIESFNSFQFSLLSEGTNSTWEAVSLVCIPITFACYGLMSNIWFRKLGWVKMIVMLIPIIYLFFVMLTGLSHLFYPEATHGWDANIATVYPPHAKHSIMQMYLHILVNVGWVFLLLIGYFKFKESEV